MVRIGLLAVALALAFQALTVRYNYHGDWTALFWVQNGAGRLVEHGTVTQFFESPQEPLTASYVSGSRG